MTFISGVTLTPTSAAGAFAFTSNVAANDTVVIGDITYTFVASPASAFDVDIGVDLDTSISNLVAAINLTGTEGVEYGTGTTQNPYVSAVADLANDEVDLTARFGGLQGDGIALAATSPGANDISPGAAHLGAVAGATVGAGDLNAWAQGIVDNGQPKSTIQSDLLDNFLQSFVGS